MYLLNKSTAPPEELRSMALYCTIMGWHVIIRGDAQQVLDSLEEYRCQKKMKSVLEYLIAHGRGQFKDYQLG